MPFPEAVSAVTMPRSQNRTSEAAALALDSGPSCFTLKSEENGKLLTPSRHPVIGVCSLSLCPPEEVSLALWMETLPASPPPLVQCPSKYGLSWRRQPMPACRGYRTSGFPGPHWVARGKGWPLWLPALAFVCQRASGFCWRVPDLPREVPLHPQSRLAGGWCAS